MVVNFLMLRGNVLGWGGTRVTGFWVEGGFLAVRGGIRLR